MSAITPIPTDLVEFVKRFPGLTASGISQLLHKRSDWASGSLCRLAKAGRICRRWERGMRADEAWRYYPSALPRQSQPMSDYIIVYGPPQSGKTLNAAALKAHYRCDHVFDSGFDDTRIASAKGRIMVLSPTDETKARPLARRRLLKQASRISIREAAAALGSRWVKPIPGYAAPVCLHVKAYQIKCGVGTYTTNNASDIAFAPVGATVRVVEMTAEEYQAIPATPDAVVFFAPR